MISPRSEPATISPQVCLTLESVVKTVVCGPLTTPQFKGPESREVQAFGPAGEELRALPSLALGPEYHWSFQPQMETAALWEAGVRWGRPPRPGRDTPANPAPSLPTTPLGCASVTSLLPWSNLWGPSLHPDTVIQPAQSPLFLLHGALSAKLWGSPGSSEDVSGQTRPCSA